MAESVEIESSKSSSTGEGKTDADNSAAEASGFTENRDNTHDTMENSDPASGMKRKQSLNKQDSGCLDLQLEVKDVSLDDKENMPGKRCGDVVDDSDSYGGYEKTGARPKIPTESKTLSERNSNKLVSCRSKQDDILISADNDTSRITENCNKDYRNSTSVNSSDKLISCSSLDGTSSTTATNSSLSAVPAFMKSASVDETSTSKHPNSGVTNSKDCNTSSNLDVSASKTGACTFKLDSSSKSKTPSLKSSKGKGCKSNSKSSKSIANLGASTSKDGASYTPDAVASTSKDNKDDDVEKDNDSDNNDADNNDAAADNADTDSNDETPARNNDADDSDDDDGLVLSC